MTDTAQTWHRLSRALSHYPSCQYVDVPWTVDQRTMLITCPEKRYITNSDAGCLVGSAEQSFLHLLRTDRLAEGDYIAVTPCFRHMDALEQADDMHCAYFMKAELIIARFEEMPEAFLFNLVQAAYDYFKSELALAGLGAEWLAISALPDGTIDINLNEIEIGSYGQRRHGNIFWTYGTALAEPRFTRALATVLK